MNIRYRLIILRGYLVKVYRSVYNIDSEVSKYKKGLVHYSKRSDNFSYSEKLSYVAGLNTFFENGFDCKYFFLHVEDAFNFKYNSKIQYPFYILEYDIPDEILFPNIGLGAYSKDDNNMKYDFIAIEFAIPVDELKFYDNNNSKTKRSNIITNNMVEVVYLGAYNEYNYPFLKVDMKKESYLTEKEEFINNFLVNEAIILDETHNKFVKTGTKQKVLKRNFG